MTLPSPYRKSYAPLFPCLLVFASAARTRRRMCRSSDLSLLFLRDLGYDLNDDGCTWQHITGSCISSSNLWFGLFAIKYGH